MLGFQLLVAEEQEESVTALLWELDTAGIEVRPSPSGDVVLLAYFADRPGVEELLRRHLALFGGVRLRPIPIPEVDWVTQVREGFRPFVVGGFRVVPAWESPCAANGPVIRLDPGRAFGTGTHETTHLCLEALWELRTRGPLGRVLDLGTGTGILAVAAVLSGASSVFAVDTDTDAIDSARHHSRLNDAQIFIIRGDLGDALASGSFDLVLANLSARLLVKRSLDIASLRSLRGTLVLSGFLAEDVPALREGFDATGTVEVRTRGEWAALLVRPPLP